MNGWDAAAFDRWLTTDPVNRPEYRDDDEISAAYETRRERLARANRNGEVFEPCRSGERVATCYHSPRCTCEIPGYGRYVPADPASDAER